jgi:hypothetical protein
MKAPGDGDGSSIDDGLIAEIIPLRRRKPGEARDQSYDPPSSDVFDPPRDPEPLAEYSVWETPTAELVRREPPRHRAPGVEAWLKLPRGVHRYRWLAAAALLAVGLIVVALAAVPLGGHEHSPATLGQLRSPAGLRQALGGVTTSRPLPRGGKSSTAHRRAHNQTTADGAHRHLSAGPRTPAPDHVPSSEATRPSATHLSTAASSPADATGQHGERTGAPAIAVAAREFGFER